MLRISLKKKKWSSPCVTNLITYYNKKSSIDPNCYCYHLWLHQFFEKKCRHLHNIYLGTTCKNPEITKQYNSLVSCKKGYGKYVHYNEFHIGNRIGNPNSQGCNKEKWILVSSVFLVDFSSFLWYTWFFNLVHSVHYWKTFCKNVVSFALKDLFRSLFFTTVFFLPK